MNDGTDGAKSGERWPGKKNPMVSPKGFLGELNDRILSRLARLAALTFTALFSSSQSHGGCKLRKGPKVAKFLDR